MDISAVKDLGGGALVLALFIIWKLIEEIIRFKGIKKYKKITNNNPGHGNCKWTGDDHVWLMEIRDSNKSNTKILRKLEVFLDNRNK